MPAAFQCIEEFQLNTIRTDWSGGKTQGGSRPPRMESNAPETLRGKASGERSENFYAAVRRKVTAFLCSVCKLPLLPGDNMIFVLVDAVGWNNAPDAGGGVDAAVPAQDGAGVKN